MRAERLLELIHHFVAFDAGVKKVCRHNQYFGVRAGWSHVKRREGRIGRSGQPVLNRTIENEMKFLNTVPNWISKYRDELARLLLHLDELALLLLHLN